MLGDFTNSPSPNRAAHSCMPMCECIPLLTACTMQVCVSVGVYVWRKHFSSHSWVCIYPLRWWAAFTPQKISAPWNVFAQKKKSLVRWWSCASMAFNFSLRDNVCLYAISGKCLGMMCDTRSEPPLWCVTLEVNHFYLPIPQEAYSEILIACIAPPYTYETYLWLGSLLHIWLINTRSSGHSTKLRSGRDCSVKHVIYYAEHMLQKHTHTHRRWNILCALYALYQNPHTETKWNSTP